MNTNKNKLTSGFTSGITPLHRIAEWPQHRWPWLLLALVSTGLVITALVMQHVQGLNPCVQCIYQRTAMIGVALFAWLGFLAPQKAFVRIVAYAGWITSAWAGLSAANHHLWLQREANPLFNSCAAFPDFPTWAPLHEWFPSIFAVTGMCGDDGWRLLGLNMPEWMQIIFFILLAIAVVILVIRLLYLRKV
ncbi:disulfide bond formation protein DsbB [Aliidiomarina shirensis]|uniref:Disulfide bond formation protein B n=1 Tax=Aliidiomarina shirensis TaxID=1048642 RepID=A0A432WTY9_9GAMM|nr:disulfide bond formation protein DsbB [Aliidiomarina shirensis]RUO37217.1 disulfide bond formation protein DsbB [Aliidiomarina shirensis]